MGWIPALAQVMVQDRARGLVTGLGQERALVQELVQELVRVAAEVQP